MTDDDDDELNNALINGLITTKKCLTLLLLETARGEGIVTELLTDVSREKARDIESIYQIKANKIRCRNHKKYRNLSSVQHFGLGPRGLGPSTGSVLCSVHSDNITRNSTHTKSICASLRISRFYGCLQDGLKLHYKYNKNI